MFTELLVIKFQIYIVLETVYIQGIKKETKPKKNICRKMNNIFNYIRGRIDIN